MDALSRLIRLARLRGSIDVHCVMAGRYTRDCPQAEIGQVPFHLLLAGACELQLKGRRIEVGAGDMVLLPRGTAHRLHVPGPRLAAADVGRREPGGPHELVTEGPPEDGGCAGEGRGGAPVDLLCGRYTWESGPGQVLMNMLPEVVHVPLKGPAGSGPCSSAHLGPLSDLMRGETRLGAPGAEAITGALCDVLLTMALRGSGGLGRTVWLACAGGAVGAVTEAVLRDPGHDWGIAKFAALNAMSRATFIRHFARETGMSPGDFLIRLRMLLAADLLTSTDRPVSAVATAVGYGSESAFGRAFRLATGSTPARLRRAAREPAHQPRFPPAANHREPERRPTWSREPREEARQVSVAARRWPVTLSTPRKGGPAFR